MQPFSTRTRPSDTATDDVAQSSASRLIAARFKRADKASVRSLRGAERVWNTASAGTTPDTSPGELTALANHAAACERRRGRLFTVRCAFDTLDAMLAARVWTTILVVALLMGALAYLA